MFRFIGSATVILILAAAVMYGAGYIVGDINIAITEQGRQVVNDLADKSKEAINEGLDSAKESLKKEDTNER